ncbi:MAG: amylo-alpha-1,6-glucosidase [Lachnospiraceae bacterium]
MKYLFGKQDWATFERGEENCYLMTNGLGGFSSLTMTASASRNDHAVLMACIHAPNFRYNMIHHLTEILHVGEKMQFLSSQDYVDHSRREDGYLAQSLFAFSHYPEWTYIAEGVNVVRKIALMPGKNTVGISYEITNRSRKDVVLEVSPHLEFVPKGSLLEETQKFTWSKQQINSNDQVLYYKTNGKVEEVALTFQELYYAYDKPDGRREMGRTAVNHKISFCVKAGGKDVLEIVYGMEEALPAMEEILQTVVEERCNLLEKAGFKDERAKTLTLAAHQFISEKESTGGKTILAGYPFFEDWGRDTMIALGGCCLATRQYEAAKSIFETFMAYCDKGLMPNLFPEGKQAPRYNTVDAALLFVLSVYDYVKKTDDLELLAKAYPVMEDIVDWYEKGTDYNIHMDTDGLIVAGEGLDQVTWMDVRVGDILPTPRHGKPVEINAYWYNTLKMMEEFSQKLKVIPKKNYGVMASVAKESFQKLFWNEEYHCLKDVISGTSADEQIRCNQIWAVSVPFSLLTQEQEEQVVETVFEKLYTPVGLRTLDMEDEQFHGFYGGPMLKRDLAYHQGTVWTFPLGGYYLAYLKVHHHSAEAKAVVQQQLEVLEPALREGCIGQLPEIYDGANPVASKGCFAQAWSVGELLRVYDSLR